MKNNFLGHLKYIDIDSFKKGISAMILSQMEKNLELFAQNIENKTEDLDILKLKIEETKKEVWHKVELKMN